MRKTLLLFLLFLEINGSAYAQENDDIDYILVLNSINFNEIKTRILFETVRDEFQSKQVQVISEDLGLKLSVHEESLSVPSLQNMEEAGAKLRFLRDKYAKKRKPLALLFIGDPGWLLCKPLFDDIWKDVPTVISMARDRMVSDLSVMLDKDEEHLKRNLKPTEEVIKPYNVVALKQPVFIKETIDIMKHLMPEMEKITFISDQHYISLFTCIEIEDSIRKYFPEIKLQKLTSPQVCTQNLLDSLSVSDPKTGLIYFSWFIPIRRNVDTYLDDNIQTIVSAFSKSPIFILADLNPESGTFAGGHYIDVQSLSQSCIEMLYRILRGESPRQMPIMLGGTPKTILNYLHLSRYDIPISRFPSDAIYVQAPPGFWEKYKWRLSISAFITILILISIAMRVREYRNKQRSREREIQLLKNNKRFLIDLFSNLPVAVAVRDIEDDMRFLYWNKNSEDLFGISKEKIMNHPEEAIASNEITKYMDQHDREIIKKGEKFSELNKFELPNENTRFLHVNKQIIQSSTGKKWLLTTTWDMTVQEHNYEILKELTEQLQVVMKVARMGLWTYDLRKRTINYNRKYIHDAAFLPSGKQYTIEEFKKFIYPEDRERVHEGFMKLISQQSTFFDEEYRVYNAFSKRDRSVSWMHGYATILKRDEQNCPIVIVGANENIDKQKETENDLRKAKLTAEKMSKLKDVFLANMSHEIRTPLNAIVGFSGILADTDDSKEKHEYVHIIENNNKLLLQLINDILDLSKIEAGTMEFVYKDVNINELLIEFENTSRLNANLEIIFEEHQPELKLHIDANRLLQVMNNLMTNAKKFTHKGSIRFGYHPTGDGKWYFYLTDTGEGIPADKLGSIFERFVKLDSFKQGTGLGLSICRSIIERFGGEIGVDSQQGVGSTFWFILPDTSSINN